MKSIKYISILLTIIVASGYFFPFVLEALPMANSKMILASFGLVILAIDLIQHNQGKLNKDLFQLSMWACLVSLLAFASMSINNTRDSTFATYIISMWVWLSGGYALLSIIKKVHGQINVPLIINYLLAVCVFQCTLALVFDNIISAELWHTRTFAGEAYMGNTGEERLHGIGCALDVAGFRFSAIIVMVSYLVYHLTANKNTKHSFIYLTAIAFVTIIGNMISRSTIIGAGIALIFITYATLFLKETKSMFWKVAFSLFFVLCLTFVIYQSNIGFRENFRFGFEGFFSIVETGQWETNSNNILKNMVVWPDNFKTWLIGDGYINNPLDKDLSSFDPYYVGPEYGGYYKETDIGYLRYIFYFGVSGLIAFSLFFIKAGSICIKYLRPYKWMFIMLLAIHFIQWLKVSSDLFAVFAPFICLSLMIPKTEENTTSKLLDDHIE